MSERGKLFVVDWEAERAGRLGRRLENEGWTVEVESSDGGQAYRRIRGGEFAAVVVVASAKPSHGLQTALSLGKTRSTRDLPILVVDADAEVEARFLEAIAHAVPVSSRDLVQKLNELDQGRETQEERDDEDDED